MAIKITPVGLTIPIQSEGQDIFIPLHHINVEYPLKVKANILGIKIPVFHEILKCYEASTPFDLSFGSFSFTGMCISKIKTLKIFQLNFGDGDVELVDCRIFYTRGNLADPCL